MNIQTSYGSYRSLLKTGSVENTEENSANEASDELLNQTSSESSSTSGFSDFMRNALGGYGKEMISEEDLFAVLVQQRLEEVSPEASGMYATELKKEIGALRRGDGYVNMEKAAVNALKAVVDSGAIDETEGNRVYSEAFMGAQLDDNHNELWDDRGSATDPTMAVASLEEALMKVELFAQGLASGEIEVASGSYLNGSTGESSVGSSSGASSSGHGTSSGSQGLDGAGGFLWKPTSESDNKLVVLLPEALRGAISKVEIHSSLPPSDITKLGEGRFAGDTMNGNRPHFRFDKPGSSYGSNVHVVAYKNDGSTMTWDITDGGKRHD